MELLLQKSKCSIFHNIFKYIEDIYFFAVNTKYISSSVLKTSEFSQVCLTSEILMLSTHEMKYIWYLPKKCKFSFYFILYIGYITEMEVLKMQKQFFLANPNNFGTKIFVTF